MRGLITLKISCLFIQAFRWGALTFWVAVLQIEGSRTSESNRFWHGGCRLAAVGKDDVMQCQLGIFGGVIAITSEWN